MQDKLKQFVEDHRAAFDKVDAPSVFSGIQVGLQSKPITKFLSKYAKMINYGFGASALVIATAVGLYLMPESSQSKANHVKEHRQSVVMDSLPKQEHVQNKVLELTPQKQVQQAAPSFAYLAPPDSVSTSVYTPPSPPPLPNANNESTASASREKTSVEQQGDTSFLNVKRVVVRVRYCNVFIQSHEGNDLQINSALSECAGNTIVLGRKSYVSQENTVRYALEGTTLQVWVEDVKLEKRKKVETDFSPSIIKMNVPTNIDIDVENNSGNVSLNQLTAHDLKIETKFGHINLTQVIGPMQLKTNSGNVHASDVSGDIKVIDNFGNIKLTNTKGKVDVTCSSGNVVLCDVEGNCDVKTSFGNQKYANIKGDIKAVSASGSIHFLSVNGAINGTSSFGSQVYDQVMGDIVAQASSGAIKLNQTKGSLQLSTSFGNIKGDAITLVAGAQLKASSGAIQMDFTNSLKELRFELNSNSGRIRIEDEGAVSVADDELKTGTGTLLVTGTTTFGNQFYH